MTVEIQLYSQSQAMVISPTCSKGHVKGAFVLKPQTRASFAVDLEEYQ